MVTPKNLEALVADLQEAKILNTEISVGEIVKAAAKSAAFSEIVQGQEGQAKTDWYVIGGSGYVAIIA